MILRKMLFILSIIIFAFICILFYGDMKKNYRKLNKKRKKSTRANTNQRENKSRFNRVY